MPTPNQYKAKFQDCGWVCQNLKKHIRVFNPDSPNLYILLPYGSKMGIHYEKDIRKRLRQAEAASQKIQ